MDTCLKKFETLSQFLFYLKFCWNTRYAQHLDSSIKTYDVLALMVRLHLRPIALPLQSMQLEANRNGIENTNRDE